MKRIATVFIFIGFFICSRAQVKDSLLTNQFYIPAQFFKAMGLDLAEKNEVLRVYTNKNLPADSPVVRAVDIRWVFDSKAEAKKYLLANLETQSENGFKWIQEDLKIQNAENIYVYREDKGTSNIYKSLGKTNVHWYFIFNVDKVVVKVFTSGSNTSFAKAKRIADEAAKTISIALKLKLKTEKAAASLPLSPVFSEKLDKAGLRFAMPAGFEKSGVNKELANYFDDAIKLPGYDYEIRYFVIPNSTGKKDTSSQKVYQRDREGQFLSVALNIKMSDMGSMPEFGPIDSAICRKIFNADYAMQSFFETSSTLTKGYKYCYIYSIHNREKGDAFVVTLVNDKKHLDLFPQLFRRSLVYK
jgi:hypothetical protein